MAAPKIADEIELHIPRLIENWTRTVREDPRIVSDDDLSKPQLVDHVPAIVEEICSLIRKGETPDARNSNEARVNVYTRLNQGYRGRDLVRELSQLRIILLEQVKDIASDESFGLTSEDHHAADTIINLYLDEEMRYAISVYGDQSPASGPAPA
ncbi:MAG TPA: RsbRD N-terminal domain-containing protein [Blastocatellia bacterium]|nr:RsbRD N-terminal domain-containing protein [Blastocatellia bacterium]